MIDVSATLSGLTELQSRLDDAMVASVSEILQRVQMQAKDNTADFRYDYPEVEHPGLLRDSIIIEGPAGADGVYHGAVGPTVVYGAQREFGGPIFKFDGLMKFAYQGHLWFAHQVYQEEYPTGRYLSPAGRQVGNHEALGVTELYLDEAIGG